MLGECSGLWDPEGPETLYPIVLLEDTGDTERQGDNEEFEECLELCFGESNEDNEDIESGPAGESILITGGDTHPELIS